MKQVRHAETEQQGEGQRVHDRQQGVNRMRLLQQDIPPYLDISKVYVPCQYCDAVRCSVEKIVSSSKQAATLSNC